jgi:hypothetical protein
MLTTRALARSADQISIAESPDFLHTPVGVDHPHPYSPPENSPLEVLFLWAWLCPTVKLLCVLAQNLLLGALGHIFRPCMAETTHGYP